MVREFDTTIEDNVALDFSWIVPVLIQTRLLLRVQSALTVLDVFGLSHCDVSCSRYQDEQRCMGE